MGQVQGVGHEGELPRPADPVAGQDVFLRVRVAPAQVVSPQIPDGVCLIEPVQFLQQLLLPVPPPILAPVQPGLAHRSEPHPQVHGRAPLLLGDDLRQQAQLHVQLPVQRLLVRSRGRGTPRPKEQEQAEGGPDEPVLSSSHNFSRPPD